MNYKDLNKKITLETLSLKEKDKEILTSHIQRHEHEYEFFEKYVNNNYVILDIGCKDCLWFDILVKNGFKKENLIGVDFVDKCIDISRKKGYKVYNCDIVFLEKCFTSGKMFDTITMIHTLEHVPKQYQNKLVKNCYDLLKNNGFMFIEVPIQQGGKPEDWGHYGMFRSHLSVVEIFEKNSFQLIEEQIQQKLSKNPWSRYMFKKV